MLQIATESGRAGAWDVFHPPKVMCSSSVDQCVAWLGRVVFREIGGGAGRPPGVIHEKDQHKGTNLHDVQLLHYSHAFSLVQKGKDHHFLDAD